LGFDGIQVSVAADQGFTLKYIRVVEAGCDLHQEKAPCWDKLKTRLGLKVSQVPKCSGYEEVRATGIPSAEVSSGGHSFPAADYEDGPGPGQMLASRLRVDR
jgi:hypothetical protein